MSVNGEVADTLWEEESQTSEVEPTEEDTEQESKSEDDLTDEEIAQVAKEKGGKEGARTVTGRISKYKAETEAEKQARLMVEKQLEETRAQLIQNNSATKALLKELGVDAEDITEGILKLIAEHADKPIEVIKKQHSDQLEAEQAKETIRSITEKQAQEAQRKEHAKILAQDLAAIKQAFPDLEIVQKATHVNDFGNDFIEEMIALTERANKTGTKPDAVLAFKRAYVDEIAAHKAQVSKQSAYENVTSKKHMQATEGQAGSRLVIPQATIEKYREFFPDMSIEDIRKDYAKRNNLKE